MSSETEAELLDDDAILLLEEMREACIEASTPEHGEEAELLLARHLLESGDLRALLASARYALKARVELAKERGLRMALELKVRAMGGE